MSFSKFGSISIKPNIYRRLRTVSILIYNSEKPNKTAFYNKANKDFCVAGAVLASVVGREDIANVINSDFLECVLTSDIIQALYFSIPRHIRDAYVLGLLSLGPEHSFSTGTVQYRRMAVVFTYNDRNNKDTILAWLESALWKVENYDDKDVRRKYDKTQTFRY